VAVFACLLSPSPEAPRLRYNWMAEAKVEEIAIPKGVFSTISDFVWTHATFYRLHLTAFTIVPLIAAAIFYGCNGAFHVSFLDSVFVWCVRVSMFGAVTETCAVIQP
jgi:hypothetical protein